MRNTLPLPPHYDAARVGVFPLRVNYAERELEAESCKSGRHAPHPVRRPSAGGLVGGRRAEYLLHSWI
jgi:hypothetical protein